MIKWLNNLFKRTPKYKPPEGFEDAYKSAVNRVKQSQQTPETNPLIESWGKTISDIIVNDGWPSKGVTSKVYFTDGTVLIIDSVIGTRWEKPCINTTVKVNKYTIEDGRKHYTSMAYKEVEL